MTHTNDEVVRRFAEGEPATGGNIYAVKDYGKLRLYSYGSHFILAVKLESGQYLLNGDRYSVTTSSHQSTTRYHCKPNIILPFSALQRAGIPDSDLEILTVLDRREDQYREVEYTDPDTGELKTRQEHLLGATLFRHKRKYLLSAVDQDAKSWGQGYFLVELPRPCQTIEEAYESLKPKELEPGQDYTRQGEFFFIPQTIGTRELKKLRPAPKRIYSWVESRKFKLDYDWEMRDLHKLVEMLEVSNTPFESILTTSEYGTEFASVRYRMVKERVTGEILKKRNLALIVGGNDSGNPHIARDTFIVSKNQVYARGSVRHPEHKMINLGETWHKVLINRAKGSWSSGGRVD